MTILMKKIRLTSNSDIEICLHVDLILEILIQIVFYWFSIEFDHSVCKLDLRRLRQGKLNCQNCSWALA